MPNGNMIYTGSGVSVTNEWGDVIATNQNAGDDLLSDIKGGFVGLGYAFQQMTNQWANLAAQNRDIEEGRWTLNNAVFQFKELPPASQAMIVAAGAWVVLKIIKVA